MNGKDCDERKRKYVARSHTVLSEIAYRLWFRQVVRSNCHEKKRYRNVILSNVIMSSMLLCIHSDTVGIIVHVVNVVIMILLCWTVMQNRTSVIMQKNERQIYG